MWLDRSALSVEDRCLRFVAAGSDTVSAGDDRVPHQALSLVLLGPGSSVTHDALRLLARHMYAWRLGEILPHRDIAVLRGIEGARVKEMYRLTVERLGLRWSGRRCWCSSGPARTLSA